MGLLGEDDRNRGRAIFDQKKKKKATKENAQLCTWCGSPALREA